MLNRFSSKLALITLTWLTLLFAISYISLGVPDTNSSTSLNSFSAVRAIQRLTALLPEDNNPHPVNSPSNDLFRKNIIKQLNDLGMETEVQKTMGCHSSRGRLSCAKVNNIITQIPGTDSSNTVLLVAHYDSVPASPGAADAGHAVAIILELLELMQQQAPFKNDLIVLINEGEEYGLLGAEAFMKEHPLAKTVDVVINMEARGNQGKSLLFETGEDNYRLMKLYQQYAKEPFSNSITYEIYKLLPNDTDLTVFKRYGLTGVNFAFQGNVSHYHTPADNLQNLSPGSVQHQGDNAYAMLQALLSVDLDAMPEGNAVYTDVLSSFMLVWPEYMTVPLTYFALFLLILISWQLLSMKKVTIKKLAIALPFAFTVVILSVLCDWILVYIVQYLSGQSQPWLSNPVFMRTAIWLLPLGISLVFADKVKAKLGFWGLILAGAYLYAMASIAASFYMPGLSYLTIIPLLLFSIMLSITMITNQMNNGWIISAILLSTITAMALLVFPIMLLLEDAMGFNIAPAFGLLESLVIVFAIPLIVFADIPTKKNIIYYSLIASLVGGLVSVRQEAFSTEHPMALNFEYLQQSDSATIQALTRHNLPSRITAESAFSNEKKISRPWSSRSYPSIKTEFLNLPEPSLEIITSTQKGDEYQMTLRYSSARDIDQFLIISKDNKRLKNIRFDKQNFVIPSNHQNQYFLCAGIECNGLIFTLSFSGSQPLQIELVDYSFGLPESLNYLEQVRGKTAQPIQTGDVVLVHKTFEFNTENKSL